VPNSVVDNAKHKRSVMRCPLVATGALHRLSLLLLKSAIGGLEKAQASRSSLMPSNGSQVTSRHLWLYSIVSASVSDSHKMFQPTY
jgi:hypothetical protein